MINSLIRDYRIVTELGSGGMGTVYFAEHTVIGRRAAIKVLNKEVAASDDIVARFFTEAKAVNAIRHPNIVDITDIGQTDGGIYFIIMEMLEGETLGARLEAAKTINPATTVRIVGQVASAVGAVNDSGIVHRDLKPENIFLTNHPDYPDFVKVLDFGVVKLMGSQGAVGPGTHRTQPGSAIGTPAYMSPEQCIADAGLDHRSDIYSLAVVAYEMLTGRLPFIGDALEVMVGHARGALTPPQELNPALSDGLNEALVRALAKKADERFQTMRDFKQALEGTLAPKSPARRPPAPEPVKDRVSERVNERANDRANERANDRANEPAKDQANDEKQERIERIQTRKVGGKLREIVARRIAQNRLTVPSMPAVALKCLELLRDKNARFNELAAAIEQDPLIASRLMRIVNSPAYGSREPISSVERAVNRLGLKPLKMILIEISAREVFVSKSPRIRDAFRGIWEHCLAVGTLARDLAAALKGGPDGDSAYLAGLFHDVGKPVVASLLLEAERSLMDEVGEPFMTDSLWLKVVGDAHRDVGAALAARWNLAPAVAQAIAGCDAYDEAAGRASCANLVRFANAITKRDGLYVGEVDADEVVGVVMEGRRVLGLDEADEDRLTAGLGERIESMTG